MTTKKTASELAAERLGYGEIDPHAEWLGDAEALLSRDEWSAEDREAARAALDRAKTLPERKPEPEPDPVKPERRPATASEIAAAHMLGGKQAARDLTRDGIER
ncbi:MAG: hypothetical protein JSS88_07265 [Actinobacteria bacterium]|nr:hypothetical protein [Actinomycetota bacterium]